MHLKTTSHDLSIFYCLWFWHTILIKIKLQYISTVYLPLVYILFFGKFQVINLFSKIASHSSRDYNHLASNNRGRRRRPQNELLLVAPTVLEIPLSCPTAVSFSPFGRSTLCTAMSREVETGGKTKVARRKRERQREREKGISSVFPQTRRGQEARRKEQRRTLRNVEGNVAWCRWHFVTSSPPHPTPSSLRDAYFAAGKTQCFSPLSLTLSSTLQRRRNVLALVVPSVWRDTREQYQLRDKAQRGVEMTRHHSDDNRARAKSASPLSKKDTRRIPIRSNLDSFLMETEYERISGLSILYCFLLSSENARVQSI